MEWTGRGSSRKGKINILRLAGNELVFIHLQKAHLAICDLTITHERREVVDFSMPFMTLGKKGYIL